MPDTQAISRSMIATLLHRDDLSFDQALQQSVGELGRGQRWRFCLVCASLTCMLSVTERKFRAVRASLLMYQCSPESHNSFNFTLNCLTCLHRQAWRWCQLQCKPSLCILLPSTRSGNRPGSAKILQTPHAKQHLELLAKVHATCHPKHGSGKTGAAALLI